MPNRIQFWAEKSLIDKKAEKIFAWLCENYIKEIRRENSHWTEPELLNGKIHRKYPHYKQEKKKKVGLKVLTMFIP